MTDIVSAKLLRAFTELRREAAKIKQRGGRISEQDTKDVFISPVLEALGWNLKNTEEVSREYRRIGKDNPVDYAMFLNNRPVLFVEAKRLGTNLDDHNWKTQTVNYANTAKVQWCVLSNGLEFHIYNALAPMYVEDRLLHAVDISNPADDEKAVRLMSLLSKEKIGEGVLKELWDTIVVDNTVRQAVESMFREQDQRLVNLLRKQAANLSAADIRGSLERLDMSLDFTSGLSSGLTTRKQATEKTMQVVAETKSVPGENATLQDLIREGLITAPLVIEKTYKGTRLEAVILEDGTIQYDGGAHGSLSVAAGYARNKVIGPPVDGRPYHQTNGWTFWHYRDPRTDKLCPMDNLRKLAGKGSLELLDPGREA